MNSPSIVSFTRSTPCVDGCCGPRLRTKVSWGPPTQCAVWASASVLFSWSTGEVLPKRMISGVLREEERGEVGVAEETDTEEIVRLALVPVGPLEQVGNGRHLGLLARNTAADGDAQAALGVE